MGSAWARPGRSDRPHGAPVPQARYGVPSRLRPSPTQGLLLEVPEHDVDHDRKDGDPGCDERGDREPFLARLGETIPLLPEAVRLSTRRVGGEYGIDPGDLGRLRRADHMVSLGAGSDQENAEKGGSTDEGVGGAAHCVRGG